MSSASTPSPQRYFCHQCERTVTITPSPFSDLSCPLCQGGFLEEFEIPNPNPTPDPFPLPDHFSSLFPSPSSTTSSSSSFDVQHPGDLFSLLGFDPTTRSLAPSSSAPVGGPPEQFSPIHFLQSYFQSLMAGGANFHVVVESGSGGSPATFGDYFVGPGLEQLIQHLMDNDPNRYGTPPASKSVVDRLPDVRISREMIAGDDDEAQCAVCKDAFELGAEAKQMPCKHVYHKDCILPWLELHNSCPVCRFELPTDDPDYESRRAAGNATPARTVPTNSGVADLGVDVESPRSARLRERRFRISLPWPLGSPGTANEEGGNGGGGNGNSSASGQRNRQEDLD